MSNLLLEDKVSGFCNERYPRDLPSRLRKLGEEFGELAEAIARGRKKEIVEEAGDCGFVLIDICKLMGSSLSAAIDTKLWLKKALEEREGGNHEAS